MVWKGRAMPLAEPSLKEPSLKLAGPLSRCLKLAGPPALKLTGLSSSITSPAAMPCTQASLWNCNTSGKAPTVLRSYKLRVMPIAHTRCLVSGHCNAGRGWMHNSSISVMAWLCPLC